GSEDVVQKGPPGSHWPRSALRADRPTPKATRMVQKNFCSTICTHRLDSGSFIDAMLSRPSPTARISEDIEGRESMPPDPCAAGAAQRFSLLLLLSWLAGPR